MVEPLPPMLEENLDTPDAESLPRFLRDAVAGEQVTNVHLRGFCMETPSLPKIDWSHSVFDGCRLNGTAFTDGSFHNMIFLRCDLSSADFSGCVFSRVLFRECKLVGANFGATGMNDVCFLDCALDYSVFTGAHARRLLFRACRMRETQLNELTGKDYGFSACTLGRANLHHTALSQVDFTDSEIDGILLAGPELRGARVTALQACELARLLGVEIV